MNPPTIEAPTEAPLAPTPEISDDASLSSALDALLGGAVEKPDSPSPEPAEGEDFHEEPANDAPEGDADDIETPADDIDLPDISEETKGWTPQLARKFAKQAEALKLARAEAETLRQAEATYKRQIEELKGTGTNFEETVSRLKELEQRQMLTDLESTQAFREAVTEPLDELVGRAREIADHYAIDHDELLDAMAMDDADAQEEKLAELLAGASERDKVRIFRIVEDLEPVFQRRAELYGNVEEALNEAKLLEETRAAAMAAERAAERANVTRVVAARMAEKIPFLLEIEGVDMKQIESKAAETDFSDASPVDAAFAALSAKVLPSLVRAHASLKAEVESLLSRLAAYEEAEPGSAPSGGFHDYTPGADEEVGLAEALNRALAGR